MRAAGLTKLEERVVRLVVAGELDRMLRILRPRLAPETYRRVFEVVARFSLERGLPLFTKGVRDADA